MNLLKQRFCILPAGPEYLLELVKYYDRRKGSAVLGFQPAGVEVGPEKLRSAFFRDICGGFCLQNNLASYGLYGVFQLLCYTGGEGTFECIHPQAQGNGEKPIVP